MEKKQDLLASAPPLASKQAGFILFPPEQLAITLKRPLRRLFLYLMLTIQFSGFLKKIRILPKIKFAHSDSWVIMCSVESTLIYQQCRSRLLWFSPPPPPTTTRVRAVFFFQKHPILGKFCATHPHQTLIIKHQTFDLLSRFTQIQIAELSAKQSIYIAFLVKCVK